MKKQHCFNKNIFAALLISVCLIFTLSGCKIEFSEDVASDSVLSSDTEAIVSSEDNSSSVNESSVSAESSESKDSNSSKVTASENVSKNDNVSSSQLPKPVEPEDAHVDKDKRLTCTMSITCHKILDNMDIFNKDKLGVLPKDGIIYAERKVTFYKGESVFDVLARETKRNRIHMEHENFPLYNSEYIEGINNIYEFDCGEGSGWMYKVNGQFPNYGCSRYQVKSGDKIEWIYTCDLGHDIGGGQNWDDIRKSEK